MLLFIIQKKSMNTLNAKLEQGEMPNNPIIKEEKWKIKPKIIVALVLCVFLIAIIFHSQKASQYSSSQGSESSKDKEIYKAQLRKYFDRKLQLSGLELVESNFDYLPSYQSKIKALQEAEYARLNEQYHFDQFNQQLPFCIIVQKLNILDGFSYEFTLNSVFNQNYTNYKAIILHQPFTKGFQMVQHYLSHHNINPQNYIHLTMKSPKSVLRALYDAVHEYCSHDSIVLPLHRSGQLIGKNVLKIYNVLYQINKVGLIYSDYYRYSRGNYVKVGANYNAFESQLKNIRREFIFITNAITFKSSFLKAIPKEELLGTGYIYYDIVYEQALIFPLVQMMCGIVLKIDGFYLLTKERFESYKDFMENAMMQKSLSQLFRNKAKFSCNEGYAVEAKGFFLIKSFRRTYMNDQLQGIPSDNQLKADIQHSINVSLSFINPKGQSRKADKYIYTSIIGKLEQKRQYELRRFDFCESIPQLQDLQLAKYNIFLGNQIDEMHQVLQEKYERRVEDKHSLSQYAKYELPLCVVIAELPSRVGEFRFQFLLNSIFSQDYSNYFVVINNRNPALDEFVRKYLLYYQIQKDKYCYIERSYSSTPLEAVYQSLTEVCHPYSISLVLSGKQELLGKKLFKIINAKFREGKHHLLYVTGFQFNQEGRNAIALPSQSYSEDEKANKSYRNSSKNISNLYFFKTKMMLRVKKMHLQDQNGQFFAYNWEEALFYPLLELSCSLNAQIEGSHYIKLQDLADNYPKKEEVSFKIRNMIKYSCFSENDQDKSESSLQFYRNLVDIMSFRVQKNQVLLGRQYYPINLLKTSKSLKIQQALYGSMPNILIQRNISYCRRQRMLEGWQGNPNLQFSLFNLKLNHHLDNIQHSLIALDSQKIQEMTELAFEKQVPICIVVDLLFTTPFQFEYTLNSLFLQNYSNYFAVIYGDGSVISDDLLQRYLDFYQIPLESFVFLSNQKKIRGIESLLSAAKNICSQDSYMIYISESDEFVGRNVLKLISAAIQHKNSQMVYSSYYHFNLEGFKQVKALVEQKKGSIRKADAFTLSFAAFSSKLLRKIKLEDLKSGIESYFSLAINRALFIPIIEMSCNKISELNGSYFLRTKKDISESDQISAELQKLKKITPYECLSGS